MSKILSMEEIDTLLAGENIGTAKKTPESNLPIFTTEYFSRDILLPYKGYSEDIKKLEQNVGEEIFYDDICVCGGGKIVGVIDLTKNSDRENIEKLIRNAPIFRHSETHAFYPHLFLLESNQIINLADIKIIHRESKDSKNPEEFSLESHKTISYFRRNPNVFYFNVPLMFSLLPSYLEP